MTKQSVAIAKPSRPLAGTAVPRPRLFARLDQLRSHPIIWVGAAPGAGKTTLVASYLKERQIPSVWLRACADDNVPELLVPRLLATSTRTRPAKVPRPPSVARAGRQAFHELLGSLPSGAALVIDDCQELACDALLHALIVDSVADIPHDTCIILISRGTPVDLYTRLSAGGTIAVLGSNEMLLTPAETRAIASRMSVEAGVAAALHDQCGGWAAAVALTLERMKIGTPSAGQVGAEMRAAICSYFAGEVFDRATDDERRILVTTALLPSVSAAVADEVSGSSEATSYLNRLADRQLFVRRNQAKATTYEFAPLFREYLLSRLADTLGAPELDALAARAGPLLENAGELDAAVSLHVRAQNWLATERAILRHAPVLIARGQSQTLSRWLSALPASTVAATPWLSYWAAAARIPTDPVAARSVFEGVWSRFAATTDRAWQAMATGSIVESFQYEQSNHHEARSWISRLETLLATEPEFPSAEAAARCHANLLNAVAFARVTPSAVARSMERCQQLRDRGIDLNGRVYVAAALLIAHCDSLESDAAAAVARHTLGLLDDVACADATRAVALNAVGYATAIGCTAGDATAILRLAEESAAKCPAAAATTLQHDARALAALASRDAARLAAAIEAARTLADPSRPARGAWLALLLGAQSLSCGDLDSTGKRWATAVEQADAAGARRMRWVCRLALAGCRALQGDADGAAALVDEAQAAEVGVPSSEHRLVRALLAQQAERQTECHRLLREALLAGAYDRRASLACLVLPGPMAELCAEALAVGVAADGARNLIAQYALPPAAGAGREWPWLFKVSVLGRFELLRDGAPIRFSRRTQRKPLELLQAIIAFGGTDVPAGLLTDALWPDSDGDAGYHALESALYRLRQLLGVPSAVTMTGGKISLSRQQFWVDLWAFERELESPAARSACNPAIVARLRHLYQGHFLAQESDKPWALTTRTALRDKFVRAIRDTARGYESRRLWQQAASLYQAGIELDNLAEDLYRGLMVCHRELGDHGEAVQAYRKCHELLTRVLGVQPNPRTREVYHSVRQSPAASIA